MSRENALFDDDFDFGDDAEGQNDLVGQLTGVRDEDDLAPQVDIPQMQAFEGGDRAIPAISVLACLVLLFLLEGTWKAWWRRRAG